ncbi:GYF domain protein [Metarhizium album ARSEF 1941]|uniref:GYF domain protein n=1 Tax=Metarhizium album (strain ARSEF 1941) TaxID=1081103 RepID=A0A0B2WTE4_METAS|nr:GYF domain protein [Metarhizium album ARSEF 1941]KHN99336.1 GYF domain protein [Metarhizium album ARSEF 1941]
MASNLPSSFASAAAGQNANRDARGGRGDGRGAAAGDWSRRDGRSANGTLTLRRSSTTPIAQASQPVPPADHAVQQPISVDTTPALPPSYEVGPARYTRGDLLGMFRSQKPGDDPSRLFIPGWDPTHVNGGNARGWGKTNDTHVPQEPGACWDHDGHTAPMGLHEFSTEEKEAFSTEINSPLKPPTQNKEGHQGNANGRKSSVSLGSGGTFGVISPSSATRPGTRRRETIESNPFSGALASPTASSRFSRDDLSPWTQRKSIDLRESEPDDGEVDAAAREPTAKLPFANFVRPNPAGSAGMASMWPSNPTTPAGGGFGNFAMPSSSVVGDRRAGGAAAGASGSRLAHLIPKDTSENNVAKSVDVQNPPSQHSWRTRPRTDTDPFGDDELSGSAVLGGAQDTGSVGHSNVSLIGVLGTPVKGSTGDFGMSGLNLGLQPGQEGPASPSETNPYRSPPAERHEHDETDASVGEQALAPGHSEPPANFGSISRGFGAPNFEGSDRSQTSSVGAKGYPLGGLSGWPAPAGPSTGTPDRERPNLSNAFGSSLFSPVGDMQSPALSNLSNVFGGPGAGLGAASVARGSKLGSLFPTAMQTQMQGHDQEHGMNDALQGHPLGAIGRSNLPGPAPGDIESPMRPNRGVFEDMFPSSDNGRSHPGFGAPDNAQQAGVGASQSFTPVTGGIPFGGAQGNADPSGSQTRQMVMPDRMRWVYLDPQGHMQGPFTGLEMNDWYKANFFTPDLRVKKIEDSDFEPLGQLIRRIGNSREPFLVPQIGIPHGPAPPGGPFNPTTGGGVIPPLSGVFPSFGRTLTAEEQNNLERRKQEEQYMMAQQREYMMRQQTMPKFPMPGPGLQHHSSAHSLQSQPSFGSMTSPIGVPPQQQQPIGAVAPQHGSFTDTQTGVQVAGRGGLGNGDPFRVDELVGLSVAEREVLATMRGPGEEATDDQQQGADTGFRRGLPDTEQLPEDQEGFRGRLKEFEALRAERDAERLADLASENETGFAVDATRDASAAHQHSSRSVKGKKKISEDEALSLTQQVQKAQAAAAASAQPAELGMPMPFPPPSSATPLPAPTAQRARSNLPEQYSRSQNGTPDAAQPPPLAPWAKEPGQEGTKGPSLKEIQEAEARKAAKAEEAAAALRKAATEQETALVREKEKQAAAAAAAAGLPATSTWGHGSPVSASSPWIKPGTSKGTSSGATTSSSASSKKTLAEIQREEEFRKQKARDVNSHAAIPANASKSYANLAGKPNPLPPPGMPQAASPSVAGWATVGAGGKVKVPTGPAVAQVSRSLSASSVKAQASTPGRPASKTASTVGNVVNKAEPANVAMEEFSKWTLRELSRGGLTCDDAVYASSTTMDGNRFAAEYVRRKKLAEKGVVEKQSPGEAAKTAAAGGGWSEVAKRSGGAQPKDADAGIQGAGFKVVPSRKKGKK